MGDSANSASGANSADSVGTCLVFHGVDQNLGPILQSFFDIPNKQASNLYKKWCMILSTLRPGNLTHMQCNNKVAPVIM